MIETNKPATLFPSYSLELIRPGYFRARFESGRYGGDTFLLFLEIEGILPEGPEGNLPLPLTLYLPALFGAGLTESDLRKIEKLARVYRTPEEVEAAADTFDRITAKYV